MTNTNSFRSFIKAVGVMLLTVISSAPLFAQDARPANTDLKFHKFVPATPPENNAAAAPARQASTPDAVNTAATQQIQLLLQEKSSRTPAQQKIDSNVLYTIRMLRGQDAAPGFHSLHTGVDLDDNNRIVVDIVADVTPELLQQLQSAGALVLNSYPEYRAIRAIVPPDQIEAIAASPDVSFIGRKVPSMTAGMKRAPQNYVLRRDGIAPGFEERAARVRKEIAAYMQQRAGTNSTTGVINTGQGSVTTEGDATHLAAQARGVFGINGSGLKIGVISDTANATGAASSAQSTGDLPPSCPGTGGSCLTILQDFGEGSDEGTAMMEIIYDMAPGASLVFATAETGEQGFANNILALRAAGCDIIVDDIFYFDEPVFQDGIVAQAVSSVTASGALYFSSAGNEGNLDAGTAGYFEGDFNSSGAPGFAGSAKPGSVHNFGAGLLGDPITSPGEGYVLQWADPFNSPTDDYDLFYVNSSGIVLGSSTNVQNGGTGQIPVEIIGPPSNGSLGDKLVVFKTNSAGSRLFALKTLRGTLSVATVGETWGHSAAVAAFSVAAAPAAGASGSGAPSGPFPNAFSAASLLEPFTSDGPRRIIFNADGSAITPGNFSSTGGTVRNKPDITAADGVSTTLPAISGLNPFFGTSAAAPHAAAIAALVKSASPLLSPAQIRSTLTSTAIDVVAPGFDRDSGNGIVMGFAALNSLGLTGFANPEIGLVTANENPGNGDGVIEPGEGASLVIQLKNPAGVANATGIAAVLTTITQGVTITQPATSAYADLPASAGAGNNLSPFTFTVASNAPCALNIQFTLTVTYTGGPTATKALHFNVQTGVFNISNKLGSTPIGLPAGVTFTSGTQTNRINRNGVPVTCGPPKPYPGTIAVGSRLFDSYSFTTVQSFCLFTQLTSPDGADLFESAYSPGFTPSSINTNYIGDAGLSGSPQGFAVSTPVSTALSLVVADSSLSGTAGGTSYTLQIPTCALINPATLNHPPVAVAQNVTAFAATTGGMASASIDGGSFDPDGGSITITQIPPGPYPLGNTSVILTVVDSQGATAQATATVTVKNPGPDLEITKTHLGNFAQGQIGAVYTITITNQGSAPTSGTVTVTDTLPAALTATNISGAGWTCTLVSLTCTRADALANGSPIPPIAVTVNISTTAPATVVNQALVSGGNATNIDASAVDVTTINAVLPNLVIQKSHTGNFALGQTGATYTITVSNFGQGPTNVPVSVVDTLPSGLTASAISGAGWTCTLANLTCTRSDVLASAGTYPNITVTVNVTAITPSTVTNTATVSGGVETTLNDNVANDPTTIVGIVPDLTAASTHTGNFTAGQSGAAYTITVTNSGVAPTSGTVTIVDTLPAGFTATAMSGGGWTCTVGTQTCTRADALAASTSYPAITLTVNVGPNVLGQVTNLATVSGGGETNTANDTFNDRTNVDAIDLVVQMSAITNFKQGQIGALLDVAVVNQGTLPTTSPITVTDFLPPGLTATAIAVGPFDVGGWTCTLATVSCTTTNSLASSHLSDIRITVNIAANAPATVTNSATASGGGETNTSNDTTTLPINVQTAADLAIVSTHTGNFSQGQIGATYSLTVSNVGPGQTFQTVTVTDTLPAGLTATSFSDANNDGAWTCTLATLTCTNFNLLQPGLSYPPLVLKVNVAANAPATVTNVATVSGGGESNPANDVSSDSTTITPATTPPDMTVTSTHVGNFSQTQIGAVYTLTASNAGSTQTTGTVNVIDSIPDGLIATSIAGAGWTCLLNSLTCSRSDVLAGTSSYPAITLTVNAVAGAPGKVTNTVTVSGGGETITTNDSGVDPTTILAPDLTISVTNNNFSAGQIGAAYVITINNVGSVPTDLPVSLVDTLPQGLTPTSMIGAGWTCNVATVTCTRSDALAAGGSYPAITLTMNVVNNVSGQLTSVAVVSGGGENNTTNDTFINQTIVNTSPDLAITLDHIGSFTQGQTGVTYHLTVSNSGQGATLGTVTVVDSIPAALTATAISGAGWTCSLGSLTCTRSDTLFPSQPYPVITLMANVALNAPATVTNTATVSGGGDINPANDVANDIAAVGGVVPDLTITKTHSGNFIQGQQGGNATYTITVGNVGVGSTTVGSVVTVVDTLPPSLTATSILGAGWTCTLGNLTCTRSDALAPSASYPPITVAVSVANVGPITFTNVATVSGGGEVNTANDTASDFTSLTLPPDLTITKTHSGSFTQGQQAGATYTITVTNSGAGATTTGSNVTVVDTLPSVLTATGILGTNWTCTLGNLTCVEHDQLAPGASYPPITLSVLVSATAPPSVTNTATVSGGGETNTSNDTASDVTTVTQLADLTIGATIAPPGFFLKGQTGAQFAFNVTNSGGSPTTAPVTVVGTLPADLTATAIAGTGWTCTLATLTCTRADVLQARQVYPGILVTMTVSPTAAATVSTTATVSGGGENIVANDTVTFMTQISTPGAIGVSVTSLTFPPQGVGTTSVAKQITVTNTGGQPFSFLGIAATLLSNPTNWAIAPGTTCANGVAMAGGGQCVINVTFAPTAVGSVGPDTLTLNTTATPSAQNITLTGTGIDFSTTGPVAPVAITAGQSGNFTITISPGAGGFANAVSFSASGLPSASSGSFNPSSLTPGGTATSTTLSISTTARGILPPSTKPNLRTPPKFILWLLALVSTSFTLLLLALTSLRPRRQRRFAPALLVMSVLLTATVIAGCGGAGVTTPPPPTGTPAGTYPITVTSQSGNLVHTTTVTLTVQ